jgi:hypothetical protein
MDFFGTFAEEDEPCESPGEIFVAELAANHCDITFDPNFDLGGKLFSIFALVQTD